jgi:hypothetical protein
MLPATRLGLFWKVVGLLGENQGIDQLAVPDSIPLLRASLRSPASSSPSDRFPLESSCWREEQGSDDRVSSISNAERRDGARRPGLPGGDKSAPGRNRRRSCRRRRRSGSLPRARSRSPRALPFSGLNRPAKTAPSPAESDHGIARVGTNGGRIASTVTTRRHARAWAADTQATVGARSASRRAAATAESAGRCSVCTIGAR